MSYTEIRRTIMPGRPTLMRRLRECFLIITKKHSLHRAWQLGFDEGQRIEHHRLIKNKAYLAEVAYESANSTTERP